jgi:signal transduction histidine kinase
VLTNLLTNALRHGAPGEMVTVSVATSTEGVTVDVSDMGEGMPAEEVARMFDRFHKGAGSRGSGLGLTIARGIVTAHGGEISASSQLGKGTSVIFTLPRSTDDRAPHI